MIPLLAASPCRRVAASGVLWVAAGCAGGLPEAGTSDPIRVHLRAPAVATVAELTEEAADTFRRIAEEGPKRIHLDDASYRIVEKMRSHGHHFATVEPRVKDRLAPGEPVKVSFDVTPGPRVAVEEFRIGGASALPASLLDDFYRDRAPRTFPVFGSIVYVQRLVEESMQHMRDRYLAEGYLDVAIAEERTDFSEDRERAVVRLAVTEGPRASLARVEVTGAGSLEPEEIAEALRAAGAVEGGLYARATASRARNGLVDLYATLGFPLAKVVAEPARRGDSPVWDLALRVTEGPQALVRAYNVKGRSRTAPRILARELDPLLGKVGERGALEAAQQALVRLGIFESVRMKFRPTPGQPDWVDVEVEVTENDPVRLEADFGYGNTEGLRLAPRAVFTNALGLVQESFGMAEIIEGRAIISEIRNRVEGRFIDPWVLPSFTGLAVRGVAEGHWEDRPEPLRRDPSYRTERAGAAVSFSRLLFGDATAEVRYEFDRTRVYDTAPGLGSAVGVTSLSALSLRITFEGRDSPVNTRRGAYCTLAGRTAGGDAGGTVDFREISGAIQGYVSAGQATLAFKGSALARYHIPDPIFVLVPGASPDSFLRDSTLPLPYRAYAGGHDTVRSFGEGDLGPMTVDNPLTAVDEAGHPIGGLGRAVVNIEARLRVWPALPKLFGLALLGFVDIGTIWPYREEALLMAPAGADRDRYRTRPTDLAYAIGGALRFDTPIGPIGLDIGWNPDRRRVPRNRAVGGTFVKGLGIQESRAHEAPFAFFLNVGQTF